MKKNQIAASLQHIRMPDHRRAPVLKSLLAQATHADREDDMKKKHFWRYTMGTAAAFAVTAAALALFLPRTPELPAPPQTRPVASEAPAGGDDRGNIILLSNLTLTDGLAECFDIPETLTVTRQTPVNFTDEDVAQILESLEHNGWKDVSRVPNGFPGMLNLTQPETFDFGDDKQASADFMASFSGSDEHRSMGKRFLEDSGIADVLRRYGTDISATPGGEEHATLFWGYVNGYRTETYLRLHFTPDGTLGEAQLYAVQLEPLFDTDGVLPLEEAIKHAFYNRGESHVTSPDDRALTVTGAEIIYCGGFPFYKLLDGDGKTETFIGYAPAVSEDALRAHADAFAAYEKLMDNGGLFWQ